MRKTSLDMVFELAKRDPRVVFVGSDLGAGTLKEMQQAFPDRFYMEGVSEMNVIGMAAGLAMEGYIPYVNTIATFLTRRCYEQVALDLCLHKLPVRLIANGGGLVYAPLGPTHLAIEDIAIMRALPNMTVVAPSDAQEMKRFMDHTLDIPGPVYIRLGKGGDPVVSRPENGFTVGRAIAMKGGHGATILSTGILTAHALKAAEALAGQGIDCGVLHFHTVKPLDTEAVEAVAFTGGALVTLEEHTRIGGLGSAVADHLNDRFPARMPPLLRLGIPDKFADKYGSQDDLLAYYGLDAASVAKRVADFATALRYKEAV